MSDLDREYLLGWHARAVAVIDQALSSRLIDDSAEGVALRGLHISPEEAASIFTSHPLAGLEGEWDSPELEAWADDHERSGTRFRLRGLIDRLRLEAVDVAALLIAIAPDLDPRIERAFGYLQDDVTRRRASIGLAIALLGADPSWPQVRERFGPSGPVVAGGLIEVLDDERPFLTRSLRVPDAVVWYLLGGDGIDPALTDLQLEAVRGVRVDGGDIVRAIEAGVGIFSVQHGAGAAALSYVVEGCARAGLEVLAIDGRKLSGSDAALSLIGAARRWSCLTGAALIIVAAEGLPSNVRSALLTEVNEAPPVFFMSSTSWDPTWSHRSVLVLDAPMAPPEIEEFRGLRLSPEQMVRVQQSAGIRAAAQGVPVDLSHLQAGIRDQSSAGLERLSVRINPEATWDDLVVSDEGRADLADLEARIRLRDVVFGEWGMGGRSSQRQGVTALFSGPSGTGKTMAAEVVAHVLGVDLYVVDLSTVIDKYIGETEKNLDRIFTEAQSVNGILLFDEADAIFGRRSAIEDSHDRHANVGVSYLLQRMEQFDGVVVLTTNLKSNLDEAFLRRIDAAVDFPMPDATQRLGLWQRCLPSSMPRADDLDVAFLAQSFDIAGGNIRNIAVAAAFASADAGEAVTMERVIKAVGQEYRKLGRLLLPSEFGSYIEHVE